MGKISWTYCMSKKSCPFFVKKLAIFKLTIFLGHTVCPRSLVHFFVKQLAISKWTRFLGHTVYVCISVQTTGQISKQTCKQRQGCGSGWSFPGSDPQEKTWSGSDSRKTNLDSTLQKYSLNMKVHIIDCTYCIFIARRIDFRVCLNPEVRTGSDQNTRIRNPAQSSTLSIHDSLSLSQPSHLSILLKEYHVHHGKK